MLSLISNILSHIVSLKLKNFHLFMTIIVFYINWTDIVQDIIWIRTFENTNNVSLISCCRSCALCKNDNDSVVSGFASSLDSKIDTIELSLMYFSQKDQKDSNTTVKKHSEIKTLDITVHS